MIASIRVGFCCLLLLVTFNSVAADPGVRYIENKNQWPSVFLYGAEFPHVKVMLKDASIFFLQHSFIPNDNKSVRKPGLTPANEGHVHSDGDISLETFELSFIDALKPSISSSGKQTATYNYFLGNDPAKWTHAAASYNTILYDNMYEGIDLKVYSDHNQMKYDWVVEPCADVRKIRFHYNGVENIELRNENLVVRTRLGEVTETKPFAYQVVNGERRSVSAAFEIDDEIVSFVFPDGFDSNYELVIDPSLVFSSYSGSTFDNWGNTATPDSKGNLYSGGIVQYDEVSGGSFPTTPGAFQTTHENGSEWDIGILKYDSSGANLLYVTYLGGTGTETPQSLVVNANDELLVLGATSSSDFPGTAGNFKGGESIDPLGGVVYDDGTDVFIAKLSTDGSQLLKATYLGGESNDGINFVSGDIRRGGDESPLARNYGDQFRGDILTDATGNVYVATTTISSDFPVVNTDPDATYHGGTHDAVVAKLSPDLALIWSRLIGGSKTDAAYSVKIKNNGNVLVAGGTTSSDIAGMDGLHTTAPGATDGWIMEVSSDGSQVVHGTYVGTDAYDQAYFIDIGSNGDVYTYGQTQGAYPVTPGLYGQPNSGQFLHRFSSDLKTTVFSTTFGTGDNTPNISPTAFLVNECNNIFMAGWGGLINDAGFWNNETEYIGGTTEGLPVSDDAWQPTTSGNDFYIIALSNDATELIYSTFLGGTSSLTHVDGGTSRFDKSGVVYHAVCASCGGQEADFPAYNVPPERSQNRSSNCNNAAFKFDLSSLTAVIQTNNTTLTSPGKKKFCLPESVIFENLGLNGETFEWDFGDGQTFVTDNKDRILHHYEKPGAYTVKLTAIDISTCIGRASTQTVVNVFLPNMQAGPDEEICFGSSTRITATGGSHYTWKNVLPLEVNEQSPLVSPEKSTIYNVTITDVNGCVQKDSVSVRVVPKVDINFDFEKIYGCDGRPYIKVENLSELKGGEEATLFFGDGSTSEEKVVVHEYQQDGTFTVGVRATSEFCTYEDSEDVPVYTVTLPNVITPHEADGLNDTFRVIGGPHGQPNSTPVHLKIANRWGAPVFESKDYQNDWSAPDVDAGTYYFEVEVGDLTCKGWIQIIK